jgi:hypothetical protein
VSQAKPLRVANINRAVVDPVPAAAHHAAEAESFVAKVQFGNGA